MDALLACPGCGKGIPYPDKWSDTCMDCRRQGDAGPATFDEGALEFSVISDAKGNILSDSDAVVLRMCSDDVSRAAFLRFLSTPMDEMQPYVLETSHTVSLHFDHRSAQSLMSINQPERLVLAYTRAMMGFLLLHPSPRRILMIGLGGGSLAKYCYRHLSSAEITVVEVNEKVIALRDTFKIPLDDARFEVIRADGVEYIGRDASRWDVILIDAFATGAMPNPCSSTEFVQACREHLTDSGVLVINLGNADPLLPAKVGRLEAAFGESYSVVLVAERDNYIVFCWRATRALPSMKVLFDRAAALGSARELDLDATAAAMKEGECFDLRRLVWCESDLSHWKTAY